MRWGRVTQISTRRGFAGRADALAGAASSICFARWGGISSAAAARVRTPGAAAPIRAQNNTRVRELKAVPPSKRPAVAVADLERGVGLGVVGDAAGRRVEL